MSSTLEPEAEDMPEMVRMFRRYGFSSSHRLHSPELSEQENREVYGKCNNPYGHGHDYVLEVGVRGEIDERTGRVVAPGDLDRYVRDRVIEVYDHKDMNTDIPEFAHISPTTENVALDVDRRLRAGWEVAFPKARIDSVRLRETDRNHFEVKS